VKSSFKPSFFKATTAPPTSATRSVISKKGKNEIFVDVYEKLTVVFNSAGYIINSGIEGCIQMKSFLEGNPPLRLALNEDMIVGRQNMTSAL
jgi:AP-4 complex subunit mu-1